MKNSTLSDFIEKKNYLEKRKVGKLSKQNVK